MATSARNDIMSMRRANGTVMKIKAYVVLLLDRVCRVRTTTVINSSNDAEARRKAQGLSRRWGAWGYEIWGRGRQLFSRYACSNPPARRGG
jgi:hypothetical protein